MAEMYILKPDHFDDERFYLRFFPWSIWNFSVESLKPFPNSFCYYNLLQILDEFSQRMALKIFYYDIIPYQYK